MNPFLSSLAKCPVCGEKKWSDGPDVHVLSDDGRARRYRVIGCNGCSSQWLTGFQNVPISEVR